MKTLLQSGKIVSRSMLILSAVLLCAMSLLIVSCGGASGDGGGAKAPLSSSSVVDKNYQDVALQFEKAGFTNVNTEGLGDLITGWLHKEGEVKEVSIDGDTSYSTMTSFSPDAKVVIRYHSYPEKNSSSSSTSTKSESSSSSSSSSSGVSKSTSSSSSSKAAVEKELTEVAKSAEDVLERSFPIDTARRAAIVALTNATASDVFAADGSSHDPSKYHSYSDRSGEYLELTKDGIWSVAGGNAWHVSEMKLVNSYGTEMTASLDVAFDGANYIVSNLSGTLGKPGVGTPLSSYETYYDSTWSYLTVAPGLLN